MSLKAYFSDPVNHAKDFKNLIFWLSKNHGLESFKNLHFWFKSFHMTPKNLLVERLVI
jgi:hypothetical protein